MTHADPVKMCAARSIALKGPFETPGDKSISHRAVMFGGMAVGKTRVRGLLTGEDVLRTADALRALGATITTDADGIWEIQGTGLSGLQEPDDVLDMGNSGTAARLLLGILAGHDLTAFMTGDASLRGRPMNRVINPLTQMGAKFTTREKGRLPLSITGQAEAIPISYPLPVASAQVKSAVLLAGLTARGATEVIEPEPTRDHTERMLRHFGAKVEVTLDEAGARHIVLTGQPELTAPADMIDVPADPSSAAFPIVAALTVPGSELTLNNVGLNATRTGLYTCLQEMGGDITIANERDQGGEPVGDITIKASPLRAIEVPPERAPSMIDEYPILAVAAAQAEGVTKMTGIGELRVKESDRLAAVAALLRNNGVKVEDGPDWMTVEGQPGAVPGGGLVETHLDHRIAMSALVLGLTTENPVTVDDGAAIATSFPGFAEKMRGIGADIEEVTQ